MAVIGTGENNQVRVMTDKGNVILSVFDGLGMLFWAYSPRKTWKEPDLIDEIIAALALAARR